jgi:hypothetical protein
LEIAVSVPELLLSREEQLVKVKIKKEELKRKK